MQELKQEANELPEETLEKGRVYYDNVSKEEVEFRYVGQTGFAIVCAPGDSGGGMQSSWGVKPERLTPTARKCCPTCGQEVNQ